MSSIAAIRFYLFWVTLAISISCLKATAPPGSGLRLSFPDFDLIELVSSQPARAAYAEEDREWPKEAAKEALQEAAQEAALENIFFADFNYPGATNHRFAIYNPGYFPDGREAMAIFESRDQPKAIGSYYMKKIRSAGWQIIQSHERPAELLLVSEDPQRRLFTIIIRSQDPAYIKLFIKPSRFDW